MLHKCTENCQSLLLDSFPLLIELCPNVIGLPFASYWDYKDKKHPFSSRVAVLDQFLLTERGKILFWLTAMGCLTFLLLLLLLLLHMPKALLRQAALPRSELFLGSLLRGWRKSVPPDSPSEASSEAPVHSVQCWGDGVEESHRSAKIWQSDLLNGCEQPLPGDLDLQRLPENELESTFYSSLVPKGFIHVFKKILLHEKSPVS